MHRLACGWLLLLDGLGDNARMFCTVLNRTVYMMLRQTIKYYHCRAGMVHIESLCASLQSGFF